MEATVSKALREVVEAVADAECRPGVALPVLAAAMKIDKSSAHRRARAAASVVYIKNLQDRRGQGARYILGDPLPGHVTILPAPEEVGVTIAALRGVREVGAKVVPCWP